MEFILGHLRIIRNAIRIESQKSVPKQHLVIYLASSRALTRDLILQYY